MWQRSSQHQPSCSSHSPVDYPGPSHNRTQSAPGKPLAVGHLRRRCQQQARLNFPPPPNYPPPYPMTSKMTDDMLAVPGPSSQVDGAPWPNDYSYAYYVPGPPTRHTNVPSKYPGTYREGSYRSRHTYLTRYGTEENIYEEISEMERARMGLTRAHQESILSLNQSLVEEEVRRVQSGHRRVLGELNLSVEAMLMPSSSREGSDDTDREGDDQLADLLTVGPTDELLSPVPLVDLDSGFSGSSSGASYRSAAGSLRRGPERPKSAHSQVGPSRTSTPIEGAGKSGFWGKKAWKKLTAFPSNISLNKAKGGTALPPPSRARSKHCSTIDYAVPRPERRNFDESRLRSGTWEEATCDQHRIAPSLAHARTLQHTISQRSSEDSWCSGSDPDISSDEESDRSVNSNSRNGHQLRNTLNKARTLWRGSGGIGSQNRLSLDSSLPIQTGGDTSPQHQGRLSRWFSIRRGSAHQYDIENVDAPKVANNCPNKMPLLPEVEEENPFHYNCSPQQRRQLPPSLPPPPPNLSPQQLKRRMIVGAIVHSENSYIATLQRLVNDYKKPLEESNPPVLSSAKISTLFHRLSEILQCHTLFRIALAECVRNWDRDEKIGDVFVASFSKAIVLDIYSGFINNFSLAMDLAKMEAKRKSALADFFKVKQITSHDRLSFFGLMVKPVQRFPQFILFLQDLLKHTPQGHHDRMSLQLALTQLESLAEMLNERKREAEQYQAFKEMLRNISGKFSVRPLSDSNRYLLREDNVIQLEYSQNGLLSKAKSRRLLLLNDLVVCVSVSTKSTDDFGTNDRLSLKWMFPVSDVEIQDTSLSPTLSRILTSTHPKGSVKSNSSFEGTPPQDASNLCTEMSNLMYDYEVMSRINDLLGSLKGTYNGISVENSKKILQQIQSSIQQKDEEMAWLDSCCLQLVVRNKGKEETYTFQTDNPVVKKEWITELRLAQLALDPNNSPAWEIPEQEQRPSTKMPLFVKSQPVYSSQHQTEVRCGCYYTVSLPKTARRRHRTQNLLWLCTTDGASSHISILSQHHQHSGVLKDVASFSLVETQVTAMEFVKGSNAPCPNLAADSVWLGTDRHRLHLYAADEPEKQEEIANTTVSDVILHIRYHCDNVYVALANGTLYVYRKDSDGAWLLQDPQILSLGVEPVACILPINTCIYAACGKNVWVINGNNGEVQKNFTVQHEHIGNVNLMAHSGIGLWISQKNSSTICLYHTETFKHLQDINIASIVMRGFSAPNSPSRDASTNMRPQVYVTALLACKGLLWVGTNVGRVLTIPLPRLEGVPIISGRVNISYHTHFGPVMFLLALQPKNFNNPSIKTSFKEVKEENTKEEEQNLDNSVAERSEDRPKMEKQLSETSVQSLNAKLKYIASSPVVLRRRRSKESDLSRLSKTLPRNVGGSIFSTASNSSNSSHTSGDTCNVYGLYGDLMYLKDYEREDNVLTDPIYESLRRSDPELAAIPNKVSTLDRRLKMKVSRPRSLDLSNWSVDSRSSSLCTSSGSEESMAVRMGRSVSRNSSSASRQLNGVCENNVTVIENTNKESVSKPGNSVKSNSKTLAKSKSVRNSSVVDNSRRTIITLMGGRGYMNSKHPCCSADKSKQIHLKEANNKDAHIVIWELKL